MAERGARVLLVDDEETVRVIGERMLERSGHVVITCASAEAALEVMASHGGQVDVLLTDLHLGGMSGLALAGEMARRWPGTRLIVMSGETEERAVDEGMLPGTRFLAKPYTIGELAEAVGAALETEPA